MDGGKGAFDTGWRDNEGSAGASGELCLEPEVVISGDWGCTFLDLCRVGEMRRSLLEDPGVADGDFGDFGDFVDGDEVCKAGDDIDAWRSDGVI